MPATLMKSIISPEKNLAVVLLMGAQEDSLKKKEFQKRTDDDIDSFLAKTEFSKTQTDSSKTPPAAPASAQTGSRQAEAPKEAVPRENAPGETDHDAQIRAARSGRAEAEAYHDVAVLRKKAHALGHKAAKFYHKYKANEAKAQKCSAKAVLFREKAAEHKERAKDSRARTAEYESELVGAAQGKTDLSPESLRTKIATMERKVAKQEEISRRNESKAAAQTAKAAKFKTRGARFLEQNKLLESEATRYAKRADNLEKAGV